MVGSAKNKDGETKPGLRYCPVVFANNGRIKPDWVYVDGLPEQHSEGSYYISWREGNFQRRLCVGNDASEALTQQRRKQSESDARANGVALAAPTDKKPGRNLAEAIAIYLDDFKSTKKPRSYIAYRKALQYFQESCSKAHLEEIDRRDLLKFTTFLRDVKEHSDRTIYNRFQVVVAFL